VLPLFVSGYAGQVEKIRCWQSDCVPHYPAAQQLQGALGMGLPVPEDQSPTEADQGCSINTRLLVQRSRYEEMIAKVADAFRSIPFGDPANPNTYMGPLINARQRQRVLDYIEIGKAEGARLVLGGGAPAHLERGYYGAGLVEVVVHRHRQARDDPGRGASRRVRRRPDLVGGPTRAGRALDRCLGTGSEALDEESQEAVAGVDGAAGLPGGPGHGVGRGDELARVEVGADRAGTLGAGQQVAGRGAQAVAGVVQAGAGIVQGSQDGGGQAVVAGGRRGQLPDPDDQGLTGVGGVEELGRSGAQCVEPVPQECFQQRLAGREVPVEGRDADAGPAGDLPQGGVRALVRERRLGRGQQVLVAAPAVGPNGKPDVSRGRLIHHRALLLGVLLSEALLRIMGALLRL
jgi:hypothetical protein